MIINSKFVAIGAVILGFTLCLNCQAQTKTVEFTAKNTVFAEVGGNAGRYAVSYGRIFHQKGMLKLSGAVGFSLWHHNTSYFHFDSSGSTYWLPVMPLEISAFLGKSKHHLEIGTGITSNLQPTLRIDPLTSERSDKITLRAGVPIRIGYRYQKPDGGFFLRVGYTPVFSLPRNPEGKIIFNPIFAGISVGKSF